MNKNIILMILEYDEEYKYDVSEYKDYIKVSKKNKRKNFIYEPQMGYWLIRYILDNFD